jgi:hypothetical protein
VNSPTPLPPEDRFPELADFELEMETGSGWTSIRANEDERAASILKHANAVMYMLSGGYAIVEVASGQRTQFRLTPKSWLEKNNG